MPWDNAVGDETGLFPIAYLSRSALHGSINASDWEIATEVADRYIIGWPLRLGNGTACPVCFSRNKGWNSPFRDTDRLARQDGAAAAPFVWADDQFMGLALLARLARLGAPRAPEYRTLMVEMQLGYAKMLQDDDGLMYHGFNALTNKTSCCKWGRANGWIMM